MFKRIPKVIPRGTILRVLGDTSGTVNYSWHAKLPLRGAANLWLATSAANPSSLLARTIFKSELHGWAGCLAGMNLVHLVNKPKRCSTPSQTCLAPPSEPSKVFLYSILSLLLPITAVLQWMFLFGICDCYFE